MKSNVLYSLLLITLFNFLLTDAKLTIVSPHQLAAMLDDEPIPFSLANYGNIPYGAHFVGGLALADPLDGCGQIEHFLAGEIMFDQNIIAIVREGNCAVSIKTRNAQLAGAKMVIIVQEIDEPLPDNFGPASGTGNIHIPTVMIPKVQGDDIIKFVTDLPFPPLNPEDILPIVSINFPYEARSNKVALDYWMTSSDAGSYDFLTSLSSRIFHNPITFDFTPHFVTWDCYMCKRTGYMIEATDDCISAGRYCSPDPDAEGALQGRDVLLEDIRQKCAWKTNSLVWWNYIGPYQSKCRNQTNIEECSKQQLGPLADQVTSCVSNSFFKSDGSTGETNTRRDDNKILSEEKELQLEYDITEFPVLLINHKPYKGKLDNIDDVMKAICKSLEGNPVECSKYGSSTSTDMGINPPNKSGPGAGVIILVMFILLISATLIVLFFRRVQKRNEAREIALEANSMVSKYMAIRDLPGTTRDNEEGETQA